MRWVLIAAALLLSVGARAANYNEFVDGDLSNVGSAPTFWPLTTGPNILVAQSSSSDFDLLHVSVPANHTLDAIIIEFHGEHLRVFGGIQSGAVWTAGVGGAVNLSQTLGWMDFPTDPNGMHDGEDILPGMGVGVGAIGFLPPLASGDYTFLFQTPSSAIQFALDFNVRARGDFDFDANVDNDDLFVWVDSLGVEGSTEGDADLDGDNDGADYLIWQQNYGAAPPTPATATPEPGSAALVAAAWAALAARRRASSALGAGAVQ